MQEGRRLGGDDRLQQGQRHLRQRAPLAASPRSCAGNGASTASRCPTGSARTARRRRSTPGSTSRCRDRPATAARSWSRPCARARCPRPTVRDLRRARAAPDREGRRLRRSRDPARARDRPAGAPGADPARRRGRAPCCSRTTASCRSIRRRCSKLALIGPNAATARIMGGGSAQLNPHYSVSPLEGIAAALGAGVTLGHEIGCTQLPPAAAAARADGGRVLRQPRAVRRGRPSRGAAPRAS